jgi:signal transduction histidine kinase
MAVEDAGPGVPVELRERLFEPFHRESTNYGGNGLGLSIVRRILEGLGGRIALLDADPGPGLRVVVSLPADSPRAP